MRKDQAYEGDGRMTPDLACLSVSSSTLSVSGERLRSCATHGEYQQLMILLTGGGNPCSVNVSEWDDGLTALHLAVWNGHIECVEGLCANDVGKNKDGDAESCIDYRSSGGFTALHLAAMGGLDPQRVIPLLIQAGADPQARDRMDRTPADLARIYKREECMQVLRVVYFDAETIAAFRVEIKERHQLVLARYSEEYQMLVTEDKNELFVDKLPREPPRPRELKIGERRIRPSFDKCFAARRSTQVIKALTFLTEQASTNERRRKKLADLAQKAEDEWRAGNPKVGPPERELFMKRWRKSDKPRKYRLVPVVTFTS